MDPQAVELGREGGSVMLQDIDSDSGEGEESPKLSLSSLRSPTGRNEYLHSGLYSSFTVSSLQGPPPPLLHAVKVEKQRGAERGEESPTVIRFVANRSEKTVPIPLSPASTSSEVFFNSKASPYSSRSPSPSYSPSYERRLNQDARTDESEQNAQPLNLSSSHRERAQTQTSSHERRGRMNGLPPKARKPKSLEISAPSILLSGNDLGSIALNSPALPSGSLTPAFFTAQVTPNTLVFLSCTVECIVQHATVQISTYWLQI